MQISKIAAHVRFSKVMDDWTVCQAELYSQLSQQLRQLWHNGNGAALSGQRGDETAIQPPAEAEPTNKHGSTGAHPQYGMEAPDQEWRCLVQPPARERLVQPALTRRNASPQPLFLPLQTLGGFLIS